jgi:hypothetical protein
LEAIWVSWFLLEELECSGAAFVEAGKIFQAIENFSVSGSSSGGPERFLSVLGKTLAGAIYERLIQGVMISYLVI